jgi:hypothetical protein
MADTTTAMVGSGLMMMAESRLPSQQKDGVGGGGSETGSPNSITNEVKIQRRDKRGEKGHIQLI